MADMETAWGNLAQLVSDKSESFQQQLQAEQDVAAEEATLRAAVIEAAYLVANADGSVSDAEAATLSTGMWEVTGHTIDQDQIQSLFEVAMARSEAEGADARYEGVANDISDEDWRHAALLIASAAGWRDGGVGVKQGLALQKLAKAFGFSINQLHQIMAEAHGCFTD